MELIDISAFLLAIVPLYNGETAPKAMRGMLLVLYQLEIIIGYVVFSRSYGLPEVDLMAYFFLLEFS
jgi:hypothetical protein